MDVDSTDKFGIHLRKPPACLEYILVHGLLHLLEPTHSHRCTDLLDRHLPDWRARRDLLNRLPVWQAEWWYRILAKAPCIPSS